MSYFLNNYKQLIDRVDALCATITEALGEEIVCSAGCSSCCKSITIFPVEAAAIKEQLNNILPHQSDEIRKHVLAYADSEHCPLLFNQQCLLYEARPIICRTHGLPIVYDFDSQLKSDCCPMNLVNYKSLSGTNVIDLDKLNTLLVAVNSIYQLEAGIDNSEVRMTIAEAVLKFESSK